LCNLANNCRLGYNVAEHPKKTILFSWLTVLLCCLGFLNFYQERDPLKLWVPDNSQFLVNTKFIMNKFGEAVRKQNVLIVADDVLTPEVMKKLAIISREINGIKAKGENNEQIDLDTTCFK
jgi:Niemann-Pick C1 protein